MSFELKGFDIGLSNEVKVESVDKETKPVFSDDVKVDVFNVCDSSISVSELGCLHEAERDAFCDDRLTNRDLRTHDANNVEVVDFDMDMLSAVDEARSPQDVAKIVTNVRLMEHMRSNDVKVRFMAHLEANYGIVSYALRGSGMTRIEFNKLMKSNNNFRLNVESMKEIKTDLAQFTLCEGMDRGSIAAAHIELKANGKDRGYGKGDDHIVKKLLKKINELEGGKTGVTDLDMEKDYKNILKSGG